jgi:methionine aminopeptidase type I
MGAGGLAVGGRGGGGGGWGGGAAQPGLTTAELDRALHALVVASGAYPSPLGYRGFPKSVCTSVNNVVCHGIPDSRPLQAGDLVNVDVSAYLEGVHGDASRTFLVGDVDAPGRALVAATEAALRAGIAVCAPAVPINRIGAAIQYEQREREIVCVCVACIHRHRPPPPYTYAYCTSNTAVSDAHSFLFGARAWGWL